MKSWSIGKSQSRVYWRAIEKKCINSPQVMTFNSLKINRISWLLLFSLTDWYVHCVVATSVSLCYQHAIRFNRKLCRRWRRDMKLNYSSHKQGRLHPLHLPFVPINTFAYLIVFARSPSATSPLDGSSAARFGLQTLFVPPPSINTDDGAVMPIRRPFRWINKP